MPTPNSLRNSFSISHEKRISTISLIEEQQRDLAVAVERIKRTQQLARMLEHHAHVIEDEYGLHAFTIHTLFGVPGLYYFVRHHLPQNSTWIRIGDSDAQIRAHLKKLRYRSIEISEATIDAAIAYLSINFAAAQNDALNAPRANIGQRTSTPSNSYVIERFVVCDGRDNHNFASFKDGQLVAITADDRDLGETPSELAASFAELIDDGYEISNFAIAAAIHHHGQIVADYRNKNATTAN